MGVFGRIASRMGYVKADAATGQMRQLIATVMTQYGTGVAQEKPYSALVDAYKSWVYTSIDKIAKTVAMLPLHLYIYRNSTGTKITDAYAIKATMKGMEKESDRRYFLKSENLEREQIFDHPFLAVMNHPNGIMTRMLLWYETMIRLELGGLCCWYLANSRMGIPGEIWPLPLTHTSEVRPKVNTKLQIESWAYQDGNINLTFTPKEIVPIKYPNPKSPFHAMSPLMAQTYPYDIDLFMMQSQRALYENQGIPGLIFSTDDPMTKEQVREFKEKIEEGYAGVHKTGKSMVVSGGMKVQPAGISPRDALLTGVAKWAREKLITSYDLSEGKLGLVQDVNRANIEALDRSFVRECLKPKCMLIEEAIETFMLPLYDEGLTCDFDLPDTDDRDLELRERNQNLATYFSSINEERAKEGLEPVEWGDKPWIPFTMAQMGTSMPARASAEPEKQIEVKAAVSADRSRRTHQAFIAKTQGWDRLLTGQMQGYFRSQANEVIGRLHKYGNRYEAQYAGWGRKAMQEHMAKKGIGDDINIDKDAEASTLKLIFSPTVSAMVEDGATSMLKVIASGAIYNGNDPKVAKWLGSRMERFSKEVSGTTFDDVKAILREGFLERQPITTIADTLRQKFESYESYRAPLIARTEVMSGLNKADLFAIDQAGLKDELVKSWLSAGDSEVRPTHLEAEKRYAGGIPIEEMFEVGGDMMDAPGNGSDPAECVNCRCCLIYDKKE